MYVCHVVTNKTISLCVCYYSCYYNDVMMMMMLSNTCFYQPDKASYSATRFVREGLCLILQMAFQQRWHRKVMMPITYVAYVCIVSLDSSVSCKQVISLQFILLLFLHVNHLIICRFLIHNIMKGSLYDHMITSLKSRDTTHYIEIRCDELYVYICRMQCSA